MGDSASIGDGMSLLLMSNASYDYFPKNTNSSFKVKLEQSIRLPDDAYEVALTEVQLPTRWSNVSEGCILVERTVHIRSELVNEIDGTDTTTKPFPSKTYVYIRKGRYESHQQLTEAIFTAFDEKNLSHVVSVAFDEIANCYYFPLKESNTTLYLTSDLQELMGFEGPKLFRRLNRSTATPDINAGLSAALIYSNLVRPWDVADTKASLLRSVPMARVVNNHGHYEFVNPMYVPVQSFSGDVLETDIRRDDGTRIPFEGGKVTLTLHIRRATNRH